MYFFKKIYILIIVSVVAGFYVKEAKGQSICLAVPLTGKYGALGQRIDDAVRFEEERNGCNLGITTCDTAGLGIEECMMGFQQDKSCLIVMGGVGYREAEELNKLAEQLQMPLLLLSNNNIQLNQWSRRIVPDLSEMSEEAGQKMAEKFDNLVVFEGTGKYDKIVSIGFTKGFEEGGKKVIGRAVCSNDNDIEKCVKSVIMSLKEKEVLVLITLPLDKLLHVYGYIKYFKPEIKWSLITGPNNNVPELLLARKTETEGMYIIDLFEEELYPLITSQYREQTGHGISSVEAVTMDTTKWLCQGYLSGTMQRKDILNALPDNFEGLCGKYVKGRVNVHIFKVSNDSIELYDEDR